MADTVTSPAAEAEARGQQVKEKGARESNIHLPQSWPHDEYGKPMCIVVGQASDLIPTVQFGNVNVGPCAVYRPVPNHEDVNLLAMEARLVQMLAQYVVGTERRLLQWATDPSTRIMKPDELVADGVGFAQFVQQKLGLQNGQPPQAGQPS